MTPLLNKHIKTWEQIVAFYFNINFHNFGFQKSPENPNFGFDFLTTVWFGFQKTETELTFGLLHIPNYLYYSYFNRKCML